MEQAITQLAVKILFDDSTSFWRDDEDSYFTREAEIIDIVYDLDKDYLKWLKCGPKNCNSFAQWFYLTIFTAIYGSHSQSKNGLFFPNFMYFRTYFPNFNKIFSQMLSKR